jgi:BioD-like phosphotransacetylase family protein
VSDHHEWLYISEVAIILRVSPSTIRERIRDRSRADAIPETLINGEGHALRIHRSVAFPLMSNASAPNLSESDKDDIAERVMRMFAARFVGEAA